MRRASRILVAATLLFSAVVASSGIMPAPRPVVPLAGLNELWNGYGDQGGHWTGGDRTVSVPLPDGRTAWLFSDTFLGTVNPDHSRPPDSPIARNTLVVQRPDGTLGETLHGGTADDPEALIGLAGSDEHYWVGDGVVQGDVLRVLYNRYRTTGSGGLDFRSTGTSLATFRLPELTPSELLVIPVSDKVAWGSELLEDGGYTYIYGAEQGHLRLARVPAGGLRGPWQFWTGAGWSSREEDSARMLAGVGTAFSVTRVGGEYVLITMDTSPGFSPVMLAYTASSPSGPFRNPVVLHRASEASDRRIVYDATAHPQLSRPGKLVVSYNVNSLDHADNIADARIYRPRFVEVAWPPLVSVLGRSNRPYHSRPA
ncbi:DUF5005 domain-containing protein [Amycolatopsis sp. WAC 01376]|uniref:DUF5005 domain-containing protein n=1 Tax=Amycolatopsis sp. WAC 01376 TaxID=2203195 RepID=UPI000F7A9E60|nr:DUF5005 domain-containing protein [Amycolatopsis sp. WAC 01376]RSM57509.1 DUF5005 domain-containing protein [Amycolatopsis sp. WAC 01376]